MKCEEIEGLVVDYLDGKLDEKKAAEIEKHLETCERCLDEMKETQHALKLMSENRIENPDESLRINFYHMLHDEIRKNEVKHASSEESIKIMWYDRAIFKVAAGVALLIIGTFTGMLLFSVFSKPGQQKEISELRSEVNSLKKTAMFTMLKDGSSSYRIQAVGYAEEMISPDKSVIDVLVKTLNSDRNVNVRMSAAYALSKYSSLGMVRDSLVRSLSVQTDPILQVTLINILVELREKSALKPIERIISDEKTLKDVKTVAEQGVKFLL